MKDGFIKVSCATPEISVADVAYNKEKIIALIKKAETEGVRILALPELCVTGATCGDLFFQDVLIEACKQAVIEICRSVPEDMVVVFGAPVSVNGRLYNCAVVSSAGGILGIVSGNSQSDRYFSSLSSDGAVKGVSVEFGEFKTILSSGRLFTCNTPFPFSFTVEFGEELFSLCSPSVRYAYSGANLIINISSFASYSGRKQSVFEAAISKSLFLNAAFMVSSAGYGESTTDYVYSGQNIVAENGEELASQNMAEDSLLITEIDIRKLNFIRKSNDCFKKYQTEDDEVVLFNLGMKDTVLTRKIAKNPFLSDTTEKKRIECEEILTLQALGLKKRIEHTHSKKVILGISGGLDSTLALLVCAKAFDMLHLNRRGIFCITMPCFGTSFGTKNNAVNLVNSLGCTIREISISVSVLQHFKDIGHDRNEFTTTFENAQARERTQVLMDLSNKEGGFVVGTGDLSELALGWATYNGDHMSMYCVNGSVPKTVIREIVGFEAEKTDNIFLKNTLKAILDTPVSPELLPGSQNTEEILGSYSLHDFFIFNMLKYGFAPSKLYRLAKYAFGDDFSDDEIKNALKVFCKRFFAQQFKRSCMPDGPAVTPVSLSPRGAFALPSDISNSVFLAELEESIR